MRLIFAALSFALVATGSAWGQAYPTKPVRLIIGGLPGTAPDIIARIIGPSMTESMGHSLILDNRGGGGGLLGAQITAAAAPDGYTFLIVGGGSLVIIPYLTNKPPYDPVGDFTPVTLVSLAPLVLASTLSLPVKSVQELISLSKAKPKDLLYGTPGVGTIHHLTVEMLNSAAGIHLGHVPYKGGPPAVIDAIAGRVQVVITTVIPLSPHIKAARIRGLAVTSAKRTSVFPDLPTVQESGVPGFESHQWFGVFAPKSTSAAYRERFFKEVRMATEKPGATTILDQEGQLLAVNGPKALNEFVRTETAQWTKVISQLVAAGAIELR
ncbi:MAG TPA: tripartite tricarboxylate transporter substrate-binding protein [Burkholderiales bacterium]|nr:tripartite tricarboxylate transporter substrate-binding protein [Burkholderiales bacterium]